ncbi:hypothetical protein G6F46_012794 [Rhizopus delemar]|nr:hypothetical protein G6F46_012794 [Rhizopus delemar]
MRRLGNEQAGRQVAVALVGVFDGNNRLEQAQGLLAEAGNVAAIVVQAEAFQKVALRVPEGKRALLRLHGLAAYPRQNHAGNGAVGDAMPATGRRDSQRKAARVAAVEHSGRKLRVGVGQGGLCQRAGHVAQRAGRPRLLLLDL